MEPNDSDKHRDKIRKSGSSTSNRPPNEEAMELDNPPNPDNPDRLEESDTKVRILSAGDESSYRLESYSLPDMHRFIEELRRRKLSEASYRLESLCGEYRISSPDYEPQYTWEITGDKSETYWEEMYASTGRREVDVNADVHRAKYNLLYDGYRLERQPYDAEEVVDSDSELEDNADEGRIEEHRRKVEENREPRRDYLEKYFPQKMKWIRQRDMYKKEMEDGKAEIGEDSELEEDADARRIEEHKRNKRCRDLWQKMYPPNGENLLMSAHNRYHPDSGEDAAAVVDHLDSSSEYCGVETDYETEGYIPLRSNISGGFKFILCPLMDPNYRPILVNASVNVFVPPFAASEEALTRDEWRTSVVGKISPWIDLDSEDETLRKDSKIVLEQQVAWASQLSVTACLLPTPKGGSSFANYARCASQILTKFKHMSLLLRIPLEKTDGDSERDADQLSGGEYDSWETWNCFHLLCGCHLRLKVCLDILPSLPSINSIGRWFGEPLYYGIISTDSFLKSACGYPYLSKSHKRLITGFFNRGTAIVISVSEHLKNASKVTPIDLGRPYLNCIAKLYLKMGPGNYFQEQRDDGISWDKLYAPLKLVRNYMGVYSEFRITDVVKDAKYIPYKKAVAQALLDKVSDEVSGTTTVLMVVGFGCASLVRLSLEAAEETGRKLRVYAVEKNPFALLVLHDLIVTEEWEEEVTLVQGGRRKWYLKKLIFWLVSYWDLLVKTSCLQSILMELKGS